MFPRLITYITSIFAAFFGLLLTLPSHAPVAPTASVMQPAAVVNEEGGAVTITGSADYTDPLFPRLASQPILLMSDSSSWVDRTFDPDYVLPMDAQVIGQITSDIYEPPFTYTLRLPEFPPGEYRDVDNDGEDDTGVLINDVSVAFNIWGDPYIEKRDAFSGLYSLKLKEVFLEGEEYPHRYEIVGGKFIVYAPDDQQGFPSGFGADGLLFTADDPTAQLPQGYTIVNMSTTPFTFDRAQEQVIDLMEVESFAPKDYSDQPYTEAFDSLLAQMRREYAYTDFKGIDWDALEAEFRPRVEQAEAERSARAFGLALRDLARSIPDGHVGVSSPALAMVSNVTPDIAGGLGIAIRELDDGRFIVNFVGDGSPAADAGVELRAELIAIDGTPIGDLVNRLPGLNPPYGSPTLKRLEQIRQVVRFPLDEDVEITFQNPGDSEPKTATMTTVEDEESRLFSRTQLYGELQGPSAIHLPVEFKMLDNGLGYVRIASFSDDPVLTIRLWERMINILNGLRVPGLIIDMRQNSGGVTTLYIPMSSYFFDDPLVAGKTIYYVDELGDFYDDPLYETKLIPPDEPGLRYHGEIAVLVSPVCFSACEFFTYNMTLDNRAAIVGQYPTGGLGGPVEYVFLPDDTVFQFTYGRSVDPQGSIHIEGSGVEPTVRVPVNEETVFSEGDPILDAAVAYLEEKIGE